MRVFISWSGDESRRIADALNDWLPHVIQALKPWVSTRDLSSGDRWFAGIMESLESHDFGLLCLTQSNLESTWIHFEAGALAKSVAEGRVVPLLHGVEPNNLVDPLRQFNAEVLDKNGIERLLDSINRMLTPPLSASVLATAIERHWASFQQALSSIDGARRQSQHGEPSIASIDRKLDEILSRTVTQVAERPPDGQRRPTSSSRPLGQLERELDRHGLTGFRDTRAFRRFLIDVDDLSQLPASVSEKVRGLLLDGWTIETRSARHIIHFDHKSRAIEAAEPFLFPTNLRRP